MRWSHPEHMDTRKRKGFLWLPKRIGTVTKWLEYATWVDSYKGFAAPRCWKADYWTTTDDAR